MTRRLTTALALCAVLAVGAADAGAQSAVTIEATGTSADGTDARQKAIDQAFAGAVRTAVQRELTVAERRRARAVIERELVRRARLYIVSFRVVRSENVEGRLMVEVEAKIDRDALLGKLAELGVRAAAPAARSRGTRPRLVVLLHASRGGSVDTTFGARGGNGGPAGAALASQLDALGFATVSAAGKPAPTSTDAAAGLPVGDAAAAELARSVGAGGAVIVGVEAIPEGAIRATRKRGAAARATVRVIDVVTGKLVASTRVEAAGVAGTDSDAVAAAAAEIGRTVGERLAGALARYWPGEAPLSADGRLVVIRDATRWASVEAIVARLRAIPGAGQVAIRRLRPGAVAVQVSESLTPAQLVRHLGSVSLPLGTASARAEGDRVEVTVDGDRESGD